jgi:hypothetical protein
MLLSASPRPDAVNALNRFDKALCIRRILAQRKRGDLKLQADVPWTLERIGIAKRELGDHPGADDAFLEAWVIRQDISDSDRDNTGSLEDLYLILSRVADHRLDRGEAGTAYAFYRRAELVMNRFEKLRGDALVLRQRRDRDAIIRAPEAREPKALSALAPDDARQVAKDPEGVLRSERLGIERRLAQLRAGKEACLSELTDALKRLMPARTRVTQ